MEFDGSHPVAGAAARLCRTKHGHVPTFEDVACPQCWEAAVIADKEAAVEAGLPEQCPADPNLIDAVAVERAVAGEPVELTVAEWEAAKRALMFRRGLCVSRARHLLAANVTVVDALGNRLDAAVLGMQVKRRRHRTFARSRWARENRRTTRRRRFVIAAGLTDECEVA